MLTFQDFHFFALLLTLLMLPTPLRRISKRIKAVSSGVPLEFAMRPTAHGWRTFADAMAIKGDNFLLLRLAAAFAVVYGHSYAISGIPKAEDHIARLGLGYGLYSGSIAVNAFFVISGFLVTGAWFRNPDLRFFVCSRLLRILPAYAVCLICSAFLLGAAFTTLPLNDYLSDASTRGYVTINLWFGRDLSWSLPGVFKQNPYPNTINGSIWTLSAEWRMYAWLAIFAVVGLLERRRLCLLCLVSLIALTWSETMLPMLPIEDYVRLAGYFSLGSLAFQWRDRLPFHGGLVLVMAAVCVSLHGRPGFTQAFAISLSYGVLWFAYGPKSLLSFNRLGDYSYGVYLWGFPVQQTIAHLVPDSTPTMITMISLPLALIIGILSWHMIEKPALRLKYRNRPDLVQPAACKHFLLHS